MTGVSMVCTECKSNNRRELKTEMMIHHAGFPNGRADVFVFPVAWVCLECGFSTFRISPIELQALRDGDVEVVQSGRVCSDRLRGQNYGPTVPTVPTPAPYLLT
jgi:hypothetical protein